MRYVYCEHEENSIIDTDGSVDQSEVIASAFAGIAMYRAVQGSTPAALAMGMTTTDAVQTQALVLGMRQP